MSCTNLKQYNISIKHLQDENCSPVKLIEVSTLSGELIPVGSLQFQSDNPNFIGDGSGYVRSYYTDVNGVIIPTPTIRVDCQCVQCDLPQARFTSKNYIGGGSQTFETTLDLEYNPNKPLNTGDIVKFSVKVDGDLFEILEGEYGTSFTGFTTNNANGLNSFGSGIVNDNGTLSLDIKDYLLANNLPCLEEVCIMINVFDIETNSWEVNEDGKEICFAFNNLPPVTKATSVLLTCAEQIADFNITWDLKDFNGVPLVVGDLVKINVTSKVTGTFIGEATFNYGDDISTATPISENNFTTNLQPYFAVSTLTDGSISTFLKYDAVSNFNLNNSGALAGVDKGEEWVVTVESYDQDQCSWSNNIDNTTEIEKVNQYYSLYMGLTRAPSWAYDNIGGSYVSNVNGNNPQGVIAYAWVNHPASGRGVELVGKSFDWENNTDNAGWIPTTPLPALDTILGGSRIAVGTSIDSPVNGSTVTIHEIRGTFNQYDDFLGLPTLYGYDKTEIRDNLFNYGANAFFSGSPDCSNLQTMTASNRDGANSMDNWEMWISTNAGEDAETVGTLLQQKANPGDPDSWNGSHTFPTEGVYKSYGFNSDGGVKFAERETQILKFSL